MAQAKRVSSAIAPLRIGGVQKIHKTHLRTHTVLCPAAEAILATA
jgi:hypothetical protein